MFVTILRNEFMKSNTLFLEKNNQMHGNWNRIENSVQLVQNNGVAESQSDSQVQHAQIAQGPPETVKVKTKTTIFFVAIAENVLLEIFSYLNVEDVVSVAQVGNFL